MRIAARKDFPRIIEILAKAFDSNPSVTWVVKNDKKRPARVRALAAYSVKTAARRKGVYLSDNGHGIALCYRYNAKKEWITDFWNQAILVSKCIGLRNIFKVLQRERYTKSMRPKSGDYLYFWYYGVEPGHNGNGDAKDIKDEIFTMADKLALPVYLETSVEKNRRVYVRYGFEVYAQWFVKDQQITLYFLRRNPDKLKK